MTVPIDLMMLHDDAYTMYSYLVGLVLESLMLFLDLLKTFFFSNGKSTTLEIYTEYGNMYYCLWFLNQIQALNILICLLFNIF